MDSITSEQISHPLPTTSEPTTTTDALPSLSNGAPPPKPAGSETTYAPPSTEATAMPEIAINGSAPAELTNGHSAKTDGPAANGTTNGHSAHTDIPPTNGTTTTTTTTAASPRTAHPFPTLAGKVALVTGASRGIGAGIALELGARGASVVVNYVKGLSGAESICAQIAASGSRAIPIQADVSRVPEITRLFDAAVAHFGKIDIVCSNSGMESFEHVDDVTEERFDLVFGLNLRAQFFVGQHAYRYCTPNTGRLILMSSIAAGLIGVGDHALYSGSKSAVNGITKSFAKDFGRRGITVNAIAPGGVKSDMFAQVAWKYIPGADGGWSADRIEGAMAGHCPLGRCAVPEDVARVVAFLAGEDGGWVNGELVWFFFNLFLFSFFYLFGGGAASVVVVGVGVEIGG